MGKENDASIVMILIIVVQKDTAKTGSPREL